MKKEYLVMLSGEGNPDFRQYAPIAPPTSKRMPTLKEAKQLCKDYIRAWNLGGGNWVCEAGKVFVVVGDRCKFVGRFSYNGRFWRNTQANKLSGHCWA